MEAAYLESILAESVVDVGFRRELDAARGFCAHHARAVFVADQRRSGALGASILLAASLDVRLRELESVHAAGGRSRGRLASMAARAPECPACARVRSSDAALAEGLVALTEDSRWADAAGAAPFCLEHVVALMGRRSMPGWWLPVEERLLARLRAIRDGLHGFAHTSAHDRRHLQTDSQRASVAEAADVLAGEPPTGGA